MTAKRLGAEAIGLPVFAVPERPGERPAVAFDLASHARARQALDFGLAIEEPGFNLFVVGEDRSGRMTATLAYLESFLAGRPAPADWVYLNNFRRPHQPKPYRLPPGTGRRLRDALAVVVPELRGAFRRAFSTPAFQQEVRETAEALRAELAQTYAELDREAANHGLTLERTEQGIGVTLRDAEGNIRPPESVTPEERASLEAAWGGLRERITELVGRTQAVELRVAEAARDIQRRWAEQAAAPVLDRLDAAFGQLRGVRRWLVEMREDVLDRVPQFLAEGPQAAQLAAATARPGEPPLEERYVANLVVDHGDDSHPSVILDPNPTYASVFGSIAYRSVGGSYTTNFTMIRGGSLHRANGGILVLRAEAVAREPGLWGQLKGALRDREIRIEEPYREKAIPILDSPQPRPIPLAVKVVLVGAPRWYYAYFSIDPDFQSYFKVKADIDPDLPATPQDVAIYAGLLDAFARARHPAGIEPAAIAVLLGQSARWAARRDKLSSRFEQVEDVIVEAATKARARDGGLITAAEVKAALDDRRQRNSRIEDRSQESLRDGTILVATTGHAVGQVNALVVRDLGDHAFGLPSRVTARVSVGRHGVVNIERMTALGGPIQQKGVMILSGLLDGLFANRFPLSFVASITFEQSYGGVEGDSASLAELVAILSALSGVPVRQDIAVTGSVNQMGEAQPIGGASHKVEGFFRACAERGFTGGQGVVVPAPNEVSLTLRDEVAAAVAEDRFHVWSVRHIDEVVALMLDAEPGTANEAGDYAPETVYGRVQATLAAYDKALTERATFRG